MLTIRKKYGILLGSIFVLSVISLNLIMDKFFDKSFKDLVAQDMKEIYNISFKNLDDYLALNSIEKDNIKKEDFDSKIMKFIVERVNAQGVFYDIEGEVISTGLTNSSVVDLNIFKELPSSFYETKNNKTMVDIENKNGTILGKLSIPIYSSNNQLGVLVLIKDYTSDYLRDLNIKKLLNIIVTALFSLIFLAIYILSSGITKPIIVLKNKLLEVSKGSYPEKINNTSKDEVGILVNSFNEMTEILKAKDQQEKNFYRNITHELKTPLTNISGYAQILNEDDFNDVDFKRNALNRIIAESNRMHELVMSLLNISKQSSDLEEYSFEMVKIKNIVQELIEIRNPIIQNKSLNIITKFEIEEITGNKQYLKMLFNNLIDNGIKYSYENTTVEIQIKEVDRNCEFSITTTGKTIPIEFKEKIFEPFVRVEEKGFSSKESSGLGLYICKNIVIGHKGEITLDLNKDKSKFIVKLPKD